MTTVTSTAVERTGPAIRAALDEHAPEVRPLFETELRLALARAGDDLDVAPIDEVLTRWHLRATMAANTLTGEERALLRRARSGDLTGLRARDEHGGWITL